MNDIPLIIDAIAGLDPGHLAAVAVAVAIWLRHSPRGRVLWARVWGGKSVNGGLAKATAVESALEKHQKECDRRHDKIDANFKEAFRIGRENAAAIAECGKGIAEINGYLRGKKDSR